MDKKVVRQNDYWGVRVTWQERINDYAYFVEVYEQDNFGAPHWAVHVACCYSKEEDRLDALYDALLDMGWITCGKAYG